MPRGGRRPGAGRKPVRIVQSEPPPPPKEIDLKYLGQLAKLQCTHEEIAACFNIRRQTFERILAENESVKDVYERGMAQGRVSIRRSQMKLLAQGNATMAVWLGKQLLKQRDQPEDTSAAERTSGFEYRWVDPGPPKPKAKAAAEPEPAVTTEGEPAVAKGTIQ